jgi:hypothetical protein
MKKTVEETQLVQAANKIVRMGYTTVEKRKKRHEQRLLAARDWLKFLIKHATDEAASVTLPCPAQELEDYAGEIVCKGSWEFQARKEVPVEVAQAATEWLFDLIEQRIGSVAVS